MPSPQRGRHSVERVAGIASDAGLPQERKKLLIEIPLLMVLFLVADIGLHNTQ